MFSAEHRCFVSCQVRLALFPQNMINEIGGTCPPSCVYPDTDERTMSNSISTCFAAAALVSFFCETGGEIRWADAVSVAFDAGARKVASSGSGNALIACTAIIVVSFFMQDLLHRAVGAVLHHARDQLDSSKLAGFWTLVHTASLNGASTSASSYTGNVFCEEAGGS